MNFKTKFLWFPTPLYRLVRDENGTTKNLEKIGYRWLMREQLTRNIHLGWIAILDNEPYTTECPTCKRKGWQP